MTDKEIIEIKAKVPKDDAKITIVMTPTINRAIHEWKSFQLRLLTIIKRTNKASLSIELLNDHKIYFKSETQGQHALLGYNAYLISIDEFIGSEEESEEKT